MPVRPFTPALDLNDTVSDVVSKQIEDVIEREPVKKSWMDSEPGPGNALDLVVQAVAGVVSKALEERGPAGGPYGDHLGYWYPSVGYLPHGEYYPHHDVHYPHFFVNGCPYPLPGPYGGHPPLSHYGYLAGVYPPFNQYVDS